MKGQEEIMGFMLVVIMVMVIGIGFLVFMTPKAAEVQDLSSQNLLYAWLSTTVNGKDIRQTIAECSQSCDLSEEAAILNDAVEKSFIGSRINGYSLNVTGTAEYFYSKGNLTGNMRSAFSPIDNANVQLRFYAP